jgi:hypothetical protein
MEIYGLTFSIVWTQQYFEVYKQIKKKKQNINNGQAEVRLYMNNGTMPRTALKIEQDNTQTKYLKFFCQSLTFQAR